MGTDPRRKFVAGLSGALLMFLLQQVYSLAQRVAHLEGRADYFHGSPTPEEVKR